MGGTIHRLRTALALRRLRRQARSAGTLDAWLELAGFLERQGRHQEAMEAARAGLQVFPYSRSLQEVLRINWEREDCILAARLEARIRSRGRIEDHLALVEHYLGNLKPDAALDVAERLVRAFPRDSRAHLSLGNVRLNLFLRDHLARDGEEAIAAFQKSIDLDQDAFEPRLALADAWYQIGATSRALMQILVALKLDPEHEEAGRLYRTILSLPPEREDARELLWAAEESDASWVQSRRMRLTPERREEIAEALAAFSSRRGVGRMVFCHEGVEICARQGALEPSDRARRDSLVGLARGFRRQASLALKRMGFGALEESFLIMREGVAMIFAAGSSILLVTSEERHLLDEIAEEARRSLEAWTAVSGRVPAARRG